jgi:hypothetical protein
MFWPEQKNCMCTFYSPTSFQAHKIIVIRKIYKVVHVLLLWWLFFWRRWTWTWRNFPWNGIVLEKTSITSLEMLSQAAIIVELHLHTFRKRTEHIGIEFSHAWSAAWFALEFTVDASFWKNLAGWALLMWWTRPEEPKLWAMFVIKSRPTGICGPSLWACDTLCTLTKVSVRTLTDALQKKDRFAG